MDFDDLRFFEPGKEKEVWQNRLPHWQQGNAVYFLTYHLADSLPQALLKRWQTEREAWLAHHPKPWTVAVEAQYHARFSNAKERWLDAGHGSCLLRDSLCRAHVADVLSHFEGVRTSQISWVVMPNHVHALFVLHSKVSLWAVIKAWKGVTARKINARHRCEGTLWHKDYFDRFVRDGGHLENCIRYIRRNPLKAGLRADEYTLYESPFALTVP